MDVKNFKLKIRYEKNYVRWSVKNFKPEKQYKNVGFQEKVERQYKKFRVGENFKQKKSVFEKNS